MAVQKFKPINIRNSYLPGDPNAFLENLEYSRAEDDPETPIPILPFEGYNFLPTEYGYRSYFGTNSVLDVYPLTSRCDRIITFRGVDGTNRMIALCEDGIWTCNPSIAGTSWVQIVIYTYVSTTHRKWTVVILNSSVYCYQLNRPTINKFDSAFTWTAYAPSFLTMAGQEGIFQAGGRLGIWDSLNSVAWSSVFDYTDFIPSLETLAGNTKFLGIQGKIVTIVKHGVGFIIYCTEGVVSIRPNSQMSGSIWEGVPVSNIAGIRHPTEVDVGSSDVEHYVYSTLGLVSISAYNAISRTHAIDLAMTEVTDFLRETDGEIALKIINGRYLFLCLIDPLYLNGLVSAVTTATSPLETPVLWDDSTNVLTNASEIMYWTGATPVPSTAFTLAISAPDSIYPTYAGALVYDLALKKWGKMLGDFKQLQSITPENSTDIAITSYTDLGMNAGILLANGYTKLFDNLPLNSMLRWGKIGLSRSYNTTLLTARMDFRSASTGTLQVNSSLDGRTLHPLYERSTNFNNSLQCIHTSSYNAAWHTIAVTGRWDLQFMEFGGIVSGNRP